MRSLMEQSRSILVIRRTVMLATLAGSVSCGLGLPFGENAGPGTGRLIFLSRDAGTPAGTASLNAINPDGTGLTVLAASVPVGSSSALSPDGTRLALTNSSMGGIGWFDLTTGQFRAVSTDTAGTVTWTATSDQIVYDKILKLPDPAYATPNCDDCESVPSPLIRRVNTDGTGTRTIASGLYPAFSVDRVHWALQAGSQISLTDGISGRFLTARITTNDGFSTPRTADVGPPTFSPDGSLIAFVHVDLNAGIYRQLFVYELASGSSHQLTSLPGAVGAPVWSPDGSRIAFGSAGKIYIASLRGEPPLQLTPDSITVSKAVAWSPDRLRLAFESRGDVFVVNADGSGLKNLTNSAATEFGVHWAPR